MKRGGACGPDAFVAEAYRTRVTSRHLVVDGERPRSRDVADKLPCSTSNEKNVKSETASIGFFRLMMLGIGVNCRSTAGP